jgi:hypothetical protein
MFFKTKGSEIMKIMTGTSQRRWTLLFASISLVLIALFWAVYYTFMGQVPRVNTIFAVKLPFELSRWWDVLLGPVYWILIMHLFSAKTRIRTISDDYFLGGEIVLTLAAMIIAVVDGFFTGMVLISIICLIAGPAWVLKRPATKISWRRFVDYLNDESVTS